MLFYSDLLFNFIFKFCNKPKYYFQGYEINGYGFSTFDFKLFKIELVYVEIEKRAGINVLINFNKKTINPIFLIKGEKL